MSAPNSSPAGATGGLLGFVGLSAVAGVLVTVALTPALVLTGITATTGIDMFENLPTYLQVDSLPEPSTIYATQSDGNSVPLATFYDENRDPVTSENISQFVKDAAVTGEDPRFYEHGGVDLIGTVRGIISTLFKGDTQGGSSITQQYVKNVLITQGIAKATTQEERDKAYKDATAVNPGRKLKEMRLAIAVEKKYTKDQILLGYLNLAPFGGRIYGIESAAKYYFNTHAKDLTADQAASLIAIVNQPQKFRLDYPNDPDNGAANGYAANKERRDYILGAMLKYGKITQEQYKTAIAAAITPQITEPTTGCQAAGSAAYFCDYVTWVIKNDPIYGDTPEKRISTLQRGGLQIYTTLDSDLQATTDQSLKDNVPSGWSTFDAGAASVTVQPGTGRVLAMSQNKLYSNDSDQLQAPEYTAINYNTDKAYGGSSGFQPGSTYKVFTLAEWLKAGHTLTETLPNNGARRNFTTFTDSCNGTWRGNYNPQNDDNSPGRTAVEATKYSVNSGFMNMASLLDLCEIKKTAQAFQVHRADGAELQMNPSDVLGTQEIAPLTMAAAFAGIANNGTTCTPVAIDKITGPAGDMPVPKSTCNQSVSPEVAAAMDFAMEQTFSGTASASNPRDGVPHIGKTGTTDGNKDTWMAGASTKAATVVWVGNITGTTNLRTTGSFPTGPAATARHRIWPQIMSVADRKWGGDAFPRPDGTTIRPQNSSVPNVVGKSLDAARAEIERAGFTFSKGEDQDSEYPINVVAAESPSGQAAKGSTVTVRMSNNMLGAIPANVIGMNRSQAESALRNAGFGNISVQGSGTVKSCSMTQPDGSSAPLPPGTITRKDTQVQVTLG